MHHIPDQDCQRIIQPIQSDAWGPTPQCRGTRLGTAHFARLQGAEVQRGAPSLAPRLQAVGRTQTKRRLMAIKLGYKCKM
jgi:hypothetical protein